MDKCHGTQIGSAIGKVVEVDVDDDDTCWENDFRVRIEIPLNKTLPRGLYITLRMNDFGFHSNMKSYRVFVSIVDKSFTKKIAK